MAEEPQAVTPQITLIDLQNALRVIDVSAERGAFKGSELTSVGAIRDKLALFLEASLPKEESNPEEALKGSTS